MQGFQADPSSTATPAHEQGAGWEVEQPALELVPTWNGGAVGTCSIVAGLYQGPSLDGSLCLCVTGGIQSKPWVWGIALPGGAGS